MGKANKDNFRNIVKQIINESFHSDEFNKSDKAKELSNQLQVIAKATNDNFHPIWQETKKFNHGDIVCSMVQIYKKNYEVYPVPLSKGAKFFIQNYPKTNFTSNQGIPGFVGSPQQIIDLVNDDVMPEPYK